MKAPVLEIHNGSCTIEKPYNSPVRRLLVLVPPHKFDAQALAIRIRAMAEKAGRSVYWLALASDPENDHRMCRLMKELTVMVSGLQIKSEYKLVFYSDWLEAIQDIWSDGDRLVCLEGHTVPGLFFTQQSVARRLAAANSFSIDVIQGIELQKPGLSGEFWREVFTWVITISVLLAIFFFQVYIDRNSPILASRLIIGFSILVEFWLIAKVGKRW